MAGQTDRSIHRRVHPSFSNTLTALPSSDRNMPSSQTNHRFLKSPTISDLTHFIIYICLAFAYRLHKCLLSIFSIVPRLTRLSAASKKSRVLPRHVAITCPQLSQFSSCRERAISHFVFRLFASGVRHITLYDPVRNIHDSRFYDGLQSAANTTCDCHCDSLSVIPLCVSQIGADLTRRSLRHLPLTLHPCDECLYHSTVTQQIIPPVKSFVEQSSDDATDSSDNIDETFYTVKTEISDSALSQNDLIHLTFVKPQTGRSSIVRAARHLAKFCPIRTCNPTLSAGSTITTDNDLSIHHVCAALDSNAASSMLPSEPDVLVVFPAWNAPPIPVLHEFPPWQLRLTQIIFAHVGPESLSEHTLFDMISSAANAPKRFGR